MVRVLCVCHRVGWQVESMANNSEGAHKHYPLRQWVLTPEKEHNLQLLSLLALLHASLHKMPAQLASAGAEFIGAVGAGSLGTAEIDRACDVIADLAKSAFIRPYLLGICNELGAVSPQIPKKAQHTTT